jgi:hypothetical protein
MVMMSLNLQNRNVPSKDCSVPGCSGKMTLRGRQEVANAGPEGLSGATWVCDTDPTHVESANAGGE